MIPVPIYNTTNEYISYQADNHIPNLELIRKTIKAAVPEAVEAISYQMPAFKYHGMLCYFAVFKDHYSLFVDPKIKVAFKKELSSFKTTKSAIHFPFNQQIPVRLIEEVVRFAAITNLEKAQAKKSRKKGRPSEI